MLKRHKISVEGKPGNEATHGSSETQVIAGERERRAYCVRLTQNVCELTCLDSAYTREVAPACLVCPYWYSAHARVTFAHA